MIYMTVRQKAALAFLGGLVLGGALAWGLLISGRATITLSEVPEGATIYIDDAIARAGNDGTAMFSGLFAGEHTLLVATDDRFPWAKTLTLERGSSQRVNILSVPVKPTILTDKKPGNDPLAEQMLVGTMAWLPSKEDPLLSHSGDVALWLEDNVIVASWRGRRARLPEYFCMPECRPRITVFTSTVPIRSLAFYGVRDDVVLFAAERGIYALELDARGTQNFQPVYLGVSPVFKSAPGASRITVRDNNPELSEFFFIEL